MASRSDAEPPEFTGTDRFSILRRIGAGGMGVVYEALDRERHERVALKQLKRSDPFLIYQFKREFRSLAEIVHPHLVPLYELFSDGGHWFFTMELLHSPVDLVSYVCRGAFLEDATPEFPVESSVQQMATETIDGGAAAQTAVARSVRTVAVRPKRRPIRKGIDWDRFRLAFQQLAEGVSGLHAYHKLHRDLKPANVLVRSDGRVTLVDFGLVVDLTKPIGDDVFPAASEPSGGRVHYLTDQYLAGTVSYMSPEQAEAAALTPASDWYSVGVMLYLALTGQHPFHGPANAVLRDKREMDPPAPLELVDGIPEDLSALCLDLLSRDPGARPGGPELIARLRGAARSVAVTQPADMAGNLPFGELLFIGRRDQLEALHGAFGRAVTGHPIVCYVHGPSGAGKSALVERFLREVGQRRETMVLNGRCYEQESVPYKAVDSVVDSLCTRLAHLPAADVMAWMPEDIPALVRVFPVMKRLPVPAEQTADLGFASLRELHSRAVAALGELLSRISERHALVVAIDDLQWGDVDSAALLAELLRIPRLRRLLLVVAYRSEYRDVSPCLRAFREFELAAEPHMSTEVEVGSLSETETRELAETLLGADSAESRPLAARIVRESNGSALFVYELVRHARAGMDVAANEKLGLDEILWRRASTLPEQARLLLEVISIAGRPIRLNDACLAGQMTSAPHHVISALRAGHFVRTFGRLMDDEIETYHDRVRESVVAHLSSSKLKEYHGRLAAALEASGRAEPETIAAHFEEAGDGRAARHYELAAERAVLRLAFKRAEDYFRRAADLTSADLDKARIYEKMVHFYTDVARFADAYEVGRRAVGMFGVALPEVRKSSGGAHVPRFAFVLDCALARIRVGFRKPTELVNLPEMADEGLRSVVCLISAVAKAAYQVRPELCVAVSSKAVNLCLRRGNTPDIAVAYMVFGCIFLGGVLQDYRTGSEFGRLALSLVEKYDNRKQRAEVHFVVGYFATSWLEAATAAERLWEIAYTSGLETNDLFHTGCACAATVQSYYMRGVPLDRVWAESERMLEFLNRAQLHEPAGCLQSVRQSIRNLRGQTLDHTTFSGAFSDGVFNEEGFAAEVAQYGSRHFAHYYFLNKMQVLYLWGDYAAAKSMAGRSGQYLHDSRGMLHSTEHVFYNALILAALLAGGQGPKAQGRREIARARRRFEKWAVLCPHNFAHKHWLIAAEESRVRGKYARAARFYDAAIQAAADFEYWQVHALANRLAARLHRQRGDAGRARSYDQAARQSWRRWGATAMAESSEVF